MNKEIPGISMDIVQHILTHVDLSLSPTDMGEVWANMLRNVYAALVEVHAFSSTAMNDPSGMEGNVA